MIRMKQLTNCDRFMISRGCLGNPWLIQQLVHYEQTGEILRNPTAEERIDQCLLHARKLIDLKGELNGIKEMRGHACWYINGLPNNNKVKDRINVMNTYRDLKGIMDQYLEAIRTDDYSRFLGES